MSDPKVSVIILTYNRVDLLQKCVKSVLDQTFLDYQILIIDDGSTDDTLLYLEKIQDPELTVINVKHSCHISKLRNIGIQNSSGKYIAFLDSDDLWEKDHLLRQVSLLESDRTLAFVSSDIEVYRKNDLLFKGVYGSNSSGFLRGDFSQGVLSGQIILPASSSLLFRRDCLKKCGLFNEKFATGDFEFISRLVYHFKGVRCTNPRVRISRHSDNRSDLWELENFKEVIFTLHRFYKMKKISKFIYQERCSEFHYKLGFKYWQKKDYLSAMKEFIITFKFKPANGKTIIKNVRRLVS
jgi:glycosyltransferase involved in cell wall biosynthesis